MREIDRLRERLDAAGIEYVNTRDDYPEGWLPNRMPENVPFRDQVQTIVDGNVIVSAISHFGSYGAEHGLIEWWDRKSEPIGFLKAEEAFEYIVGRMC